MNKEKAEKLLNQTRENYDNFAQSFSQTRNYLWPGLAPLMAEYFKKGDKVLDIGCGNGRLYPFFKEREARYTGVDNSQNLVAIAKTNYPGVDFASADALRLPLKSDEFDLAVSIAVLHHIPSKEKQRAFFNEAWRVLKPQGRLIVTVWDLHVLAMIKAKRWKRLRIFIKTQVKIALGMEKLDFGDFFIPWQNEYQRYHHAFTLRELEKLAVASGFKVEKKAATAFGSKEGNLYIVAQKA